MSPLVSDGARIAFEEGVDRWVDEVVSSASLFAVEEGVDGWVDEVGSASLSN